MISLKRTIEDFDYRVMFEAAIGSYRSALESLEQNTIRVEYDGAVEYRRNLHDLQGRLNPRALRPESLRSHAADLNVELARHRSDLESLLKDTGNDLKQVVGVLANAAESLSRREQVHGSQLSRLSGSLEAISQINDLPQLRGKLNEHVFELRSCIDQMAHENESAVQSLQQELVAFQKKLVKVQIEASTDPLTGIANRRRAGREIAIRMRERRVFGVLLLDLNKFKLINDTYGHGAGDCVLQIVAQRLSAQIRKEDLLCRWGGDEFIIVRDGNGEELADRGKEIASRVAGKFSIDVEGKAQEVTVGTEVGWAEYEAGETIEQLLAKADKSLYQTKTPRISSELAGKAVYKLNAEVVPVLEPSKKKPALDECTGLAVMEELEAELEQLGEELGSWSVACFAIRNPAAVDGHYGYAAVDQLLPFLRDEVRTTSLGKLLFRGRGACIFALIKQGQVDTNVEKEMGRIRAIGLEKVLQQKRRQSVRPVPVATALIPLDVTRGRAGAVHEMDRFTNLHRAGEQVLSAL